MQPLEIPPHAEGTSFGNPQNEFSPATPMDAEGEHGHKKKSVIGKVKDKARKLKTKIKTPKSPSGTGDNAASSPSSNEEESGSDPLQQVGQTRDVAVTPGLKGEHYEAVPDPHVDTSSVPDPYVDTSSVGEKLRQMKLDDEPYTATHDEDTAPAPEPTKPAGEALAGAFRQSTESGHDKPVEEERTVDAADLNDKTTASEKDSTIDKVAEQAATAAATGAVALGLKSDDHKDENLAKPRTTQEDSQKPVLEKIQDSAAAATAVVSDKLGAASTQSPSGEEGTGEAAGSDDSKPYTQKAKDAAFGAKDAVAAQYGDDSKPYTQKAKDAAFGAKDAVAAQFGDDIKPYAQKGKETAFGAKDAVAEQFGYGETSPGTDDKSSLQKVREAAIDAKDTVTSKVESGVTDEQNTSGGAAAARFHPGEEDKALSVLITEKMSTGAATVRDALIRPFSPGATKAGSTTTPSSASETNSSVDATKADKPPPEERPGLVAKATDVVSSLVSTAGAKKDEAVAKAVDEPQA